MSTTRIKVSERKIYKVSWRVYERITLKVEGYDRTITEESIFRFAKANRAVLKPGDVSFLRSHEFGWRDMITGNKLWVGIPVNTIYLVRRASKEEDEAHEKSWGVGSWIKYGLMLYSWSEADVCWGIINGIGPYRDDGGFYPRWLLRRIS